MPNLKDGAYDPDAMLDTIRASLHAFIYHQNAG